MMQIGHVCFSSPTGLTTPWINPCLTMTLIYVMFRVTELDVDVEINMALWCLFPARHFGYLFDGASMRVSIH